MPYIVFRTDASSQIGTGHFMRCLTLADALGQRGAEVCFISRGLPEHLQEMLVARDIRLLALKAPTNTLGTDDLAHASWLGVRQSDDAQATREALSGRSCDWLIVDHYGLDVRWESAMRSTAKKIMVIDDIADRLHDCDFLLDQNFYMDSDRRYVGKIPAHCRLLLGPRYALLRSGFRRVREHVNVRVGPVKRMLVFFGGVDLDNYTGLALEALSNVCGGKLHIDVVIGAQNPHREHVELACKRHHFECHVQTSRMDELMVAADVAIGAGGSALWERCCLGLPSMCIVTSDNQALQVSDVAREGLIYAPELDGGDLVHGVGRHISAFLENAYLRQAMSSRSMALVDGRGVLRVISALGCSGVKIREANVDDSSQLFAWRNHPSIRAVSRNPESIHFSEHERWFAGILSSADKHLLVGVRGESAIGVVRFDTQGDAAEVSIYVAPDIREPGLGRELLQSAELWLVSNHPSVKKLEAEVLRGNERSRQLFLASGYEVESTAYSKRL